MNILSKLLLVALIAVAGIAHAETAFTYQGKLDNAGQPADGLHDFRFRLFDDAAAGGQVGVDQAVSSVDVDAGIFTVQLDFGDGPFNAAPRWLEIAVRETGAVAYTTLAPRQRIGAAPFAIETLFVAPGAVDTAALQDDAVTTQKIADDAVDATKIATGAVQPAHIAGGVMNALTRSQLYSRTGSQSAALVGAILTANALCDEPGDIPVTGGCFANNLVDAELHRFGSFDWDTGSAQAGYSCTYKSNTNSSITIEARIHCLDVTP